MNSEYWITRWKENRTGFHHSGVNPLLERFFPKEGTVTGRALAPLCGKSDDLRWLADRGYEVVGVDLSEIAARAFAAEHGLAFTVTEKPPFTVLNFERITFYVGDFFKLTAEQSARFSFIYDRAALIALPPHLRPEYARQLRTLLEPEGSILLVSLEYDSSKMDGPPYSVPEPEVREIFGDLEIKKVYEVDCIEEEPRFKERGLDWMKEVVYLLLRK